MNEFKGTKGKWIVGRIDEPSEDNEMIGYHAVTTESNDDAMIDVWFSNVHIAKTKEEALYNALLISKAPEMLEFIHSISQNENTPIAYKKLAKDLIKSATELS